MFDIINEISQGATKHTLIRRETILTMYPADVEPPDYIFPLVAWEDLEKHGKTEIVRTVVILRNQVAEDVAGQIKKALDEFGKVTPIADDNKLILRGTVASLIFIKNFVLSDNPEKEISVNTLVHQCEFIRHNGQGDPGGIAGAQTTVDKVFVGARRMAARGPGAGGFKGGPRGRLDAPTDHPSPHDHRGQKQQQGHRPRPDR